MLFHKFPLSATHTSFSNNDVVKQLKFLTFLQHIHNVCINFDMNHEAIIIYAQNSQSIFQPY